MIGAYDVRLVIFAVGVGRRSSRKTSPAVAQYARNAVPSSGSIVVTLAREAKKPLSSIVQVYKTQYIIIQNLFAYSV